ncbi:MAG TPA: hypothetical protein VI583_15955 [Cyclobacteriaceae bacterium]|nr:hypothetical protein [Cyclobacteriaceae bacterium]
MKIIFEEKSEGKGADYHIRLYSKKLASGKCQVKFYLNNLQGNNYYGYVLAEGRDTVSKVVSRIHHCLNEIGWKNYSEIETLIKKDSRQYVSDGVVLFYNNQ